jgi:hypothetical protein
MTSNHVKLNLLLDVYEWTLLDEFRATFSLDADKREVEDVFPRWLTVVVVS